MKKLASLKSSTLTDAKISQLLFSSQALRRNERLGNTIRTMIIEENLRE